MRTHLIYWLALLLLGVVLAVVSLLWISGTWEWVLFAVGVVGAIVALVGLYESDAAADRPLRGGHSDPTVGGLR